MKEVLLHLARRARHAESRAELEFIVVNETCALTPYSQSVWWLKAKGVTALSGVVAPEANAPFVHWLNRVAKQLFVRSSEAPHLPLLIKPDLLGPEEAAEWHEWLPAEAIWVPTAGGGLIFARDATWDAQELSILAEWIDIWHHAWISKEKIQSTSWQQTFPIRKRWCVLLLCLCMLIPIRMTVLVPGELVPLQPATIRSPLEGTVDRFFVEPNIRVQAGDLLFQLDNTMLSSKLKIAQEAFATAEAEYRQVAQQAVFDSKSKSQLALLQGRIAERMTEVAYLKSQFARAGVRAPRGGIVLVDDPSEWIGKPVAIGERILTIADECNLEVEAWLRPGDLIRFPNDTKITLYLNASPLHPIQATLRYVAHEAILRPDGSFAYRLRATVKKSDIKSRVGLKGTARVSGHYAPLIYWVLRRPLAFIRPLIGL